MLTIVQYLFNKNADSGIAFETFVDSKPKVKNAVKVYIFITICNTLYQHFLLCTTKMLELRQTLLENLLLIKLKNQSVIL